MRFGGWWCSQSQRGTAGHRVFVPEFTQELQLELQGCASNSSLGCPVRLTVGPAMLPGNLQKVLTCPDSTRDCRLLLPSPPWNRWLQVTAQSMAGPHVAVAFSALAVLTGGLRETWVVSGRLRLGPHLTPAVSALVSLQALERECPALPVQLQPEPEL